MTDYRIRIAVTRITPVPEEQRRYGQGGSGCVEEEVTVATLTLDQWQQVQRALVESFAVRVGN